MEKELEELRRSRPKPPVGGDFTLSDCFYFTRQGIESIVDDEVHFFLLTHLQTLVLILKWKCFSHVCQLSILKSGDPAVHFWGAGVLELTDSHQQWFPVHKSEADAGLWPWHHCEILHPCPPQVEKYCSPPTPNLLFPPQRSNVEDGVKTHLVVLKMISTELKPTEKIASCMRGRS